MKHTLRYLFILSSFSLFGQQVYVDFGKTASNFEFNNSQGLELQNLQPKTNNYIGFGYRQKFFDEKLNLSIGLSYSSYGSVGSDDTINNFYEWDVDYLGVNLGLDLKLFSLGDFSFFIGSRLGTEFLIQGTQVINNQVFNIIGVEEFDETMFFLRNSLVVAYAISERTELYLKYSRGQSLPLRDGGQKLKIQDNTFALGIRVNLLSKSKIND
jgi:hypothetical protein